MSNDNMNLEELQNQLKQELERLREHPMTFNRELNEAHRVNISETIGALDIVSATQQSIREAKIEMLEIVECKCTWLENSDGLNKTYMCPRCTALKGLKERRE